MYAAFAEKIIALVLLFQGVCSFQFTIAPPISLNCNFVRCGAGNKCVMAEPQNCVGCPLTPKCVQQECNTGCTSPCIFFQRCVLVATNCCPTSACRSLFPPITTTRRPPFTIFPPFTLFPPFTFRPPFAAEGAKEGDGEPPKPDTTKKP
ncbi:hypothetical protein OESDEN_11332 [Oesophagostomum dentatum]|uniref:Trypsin Inhibitor like cysteine rich domain protein n=1 Tax=Oesophagostomum dentatum TaxID=61180 RepID=A0A0B1SZC2_OESDE|nr:hypothetical protein OESDEN_11332 [Oesophagostomum dentatum]